MVGRDRVAAPPSTHPGPLRKHILVEAILVFAAFYLPGYLASQPPEPAGYMVQYLLLSIPQVLLLIYLLWVQKIPPLSAFGFRRLEGGDWLHGAALVAALALLLLVIRLATPLLPEAAAAGYRWRLSGPALLPLAALFSFTAGYKEEIFYRAYLLTRLQSLSAPIWSAAAASSLLFAWGHAYQGLTAVIFAFLQGILFCVCFLRRRNVHVLALAHGLYNFSALLLTVFVDIGG